MQRVRVKTRVEILLTKLRTDLSKNILKINLFSILKTSAMMTQFVPRYMVFFYHITWDDLLENHTTVFVVELLASGDLKIFLLEGTYIYIEKVQYTLFKENHITCTNAVHLLNQWWSLHLTDILKDIIVYHLTDGITMIPLFLINICANKMYI